MPGVSSARTLTAIVTADCNLRCAYCYQRSKSRARMPWPVLRDSISLLGNSSRRTVDLQFTGGEPLLAFPLIRRAVHHLERRAAGPRVRFSLLTNGTLLGRREAAFLVEHDFGVQLSIDGVGAAQRLRGAGTFEVVDALLDRLRLDYPVWYRRRVSVNLTVLPRTVRFLADSIEYLVSKGISDILLTPVQGHQRDWRDEDAALLQAQMARVSRLCRRHLQEHGHVPVRLFRKRTATNVRRPEPSDRLCAAGRPDYLAVDVDGGVFGCVLLAPSALPPTPLGRALLKVHRGRIGEPNLDDDLAHSARDIAATGLFDNRRAKRSSHGRCGTCQFRRSCEVCPIAIACDPRHEDPDRIPDFVCAFNKAAGRHAWRFPIRRARRLTAA